TAEPPAEIPDRESPPTRETAPDDRSLGTLDDAGRVDSGLAGPELGDLDLGMPGEELLEVPERPRVGGVRLDGVDERESRLREAAKAGERDPEVFVRVRLCRVDADRRATERLRLGVLAEDVETVPEVVPQEVGRVLLLRLESEPEPVIPGGLAE